MVSKLIKILIYNIRCEIVAHRADRLRRKIYGEEIRDIWADSPQRETTAQYEDRRDIYSHTYTSI